MNSHMAWWIIDQLVQQGVTHFCIAPGSRSTPLAMAIAHHPKAKIQVHFDERGLGFYGLGIGKGTGCAAALIVTSGTAVGNLLPAVMEAHHSHTPLILLTADRPPELLDAGANQATDQLKIFQNFTHGQIYLPTAGDGVSEKYVRSSIAHAVVLSLQTLGPVQINWHIRDPLFVPPFPKLSEAAAIQVTLSKKVPLNPTYLEGNGVIAIGKLSSPTDLKPILDLAKKLRWPVFGDLLSNARLYPTQEQIRHFDWILKTNLLKADTILYFGERLTSKKFLDWAKAPRFIHVSPYSELQDPERALTERILTDPASFCETTQITPSSAEWLAQWKSLDATWEKKLQAHFENSNSCTEAEGFWALAQEIDFPFAYFFGNGMPIRDADHFFSPSQANGFFANRGLSGIDGNIATAVGLSNGLQSPVVAWIGDQATLHDLNSLSLLANTRFPITLIVSNNFGGGIFSHLPIAKATEHFETLFANAHSWRFADAAKQFHLPYTQADSIPAFIAAWKNGKKQSRIIELITSRPLNFEFQQKISQCVSLENRARKELDQLMK